MSSSSDISFGAPIAVTGASGWVGSCVVNRLRETGRRAVVDTDDHGRRWLDLKNKTSISKFVDLARAANVRAVIHCAAQVHQMGRQHEEEYQVVNFQGTRWLAELAEAAGMPRFVFVSTIKVNGEFTRGVPFRPSDPPRCSDPYSRSKWAAETFLIQATRRGLFEPVVLRPPLMYGAGVKANFHSLARLVCRGVPLPLGAAQHNRRSILSVRNFADVLVRCAVAPAEDVAGRVFTVCDDLPLSTREIIEHLARAAGVKERLISVPPGILRIVACMLGRRLTAARLLDSLEVDGEELREALNWTPPYSREDEMMATIGCIQERAAS